MMIRRKRPLSTTIKELDEAKRAMDLADRTIDALRGKRTVTVDPTLRHEQHPDEMIVERWDHLRGLLLCERVEAVDAYEYFSAKGRLLLSHGALADLLANNNFTEKSADAIAYCIDGLGLKGDVLTKSLMDSDFVSDPELLEERSRLRTMCGADVTKAAKAATISVRQFQASMQKVAKTLNNQARSSPKVGRLARIFRRGKS